MSAVAEGLGLAYVSNEAIDRRLAGKIDGEVHPHYQLAVSDSAGHMMFWVETYGIKSTSHWVEIDFVHGEWFGSCDCLWFLNYRNNKSTCVHIAKSIEIARKR